MELYEYAKKGMTIVMPLKERKKYKAENLVLEHIISSPSEVSDLSTFLDTNKYIFLKWEYATENERDEWREFFNQLHANQKIGKTLSVKTGQMAHEYTSRNIIVIMPEKERKSYRAEASVKKMIISHPKELDKFEDKSKYIFLGWSDGHEEEREEWRKFHSM